MNPASTARPRFAPASIKKPSSVLPAKPVPKQAEKGDELAKAVKVEAPPPLKSVRTKFREELAANFFTMADLAKLSGIEKFEQEAEQIFYEAAYTRESAENEIASYYRFLLAGMVVKTGEKTFAIFCPSERLWRNDVTELSLKHLVLTCFNSVVAPWVNQKIDDLDSQVLMGQDEETHKKQLMRLRRFISVNNSKMKTIVDNLAAKYTFDDKFSSKLNDISSLMFPVLGGKIYGFNKITKKLEVSDMTPKFLFSKRWNVNYDLDSDVEAVQDFIESLLWCEGKKPKITDVKHFLKLLAICLCGFAQKEKIILFITGGANNGKSTLCNLIEKMLGDDFTSCSDGLLTRCKADDTTVLEKSLNMLVGKRFAVLSEPGSQVVFQSSTIKRITGDDSVVAKKLYIDQRSCRLSTALCVLSNHRPSFDNVDQALLNRVRHVHFGATFVAPGSEDPEKNLLPRNRELIERVMSQEGVNAFFFLIMTGLRDYLAEGLTDNDRFDADTGQLVAAEAAPLVEPSIYRFVNECCEQDAKCLERATPLYTAYCVFCQKQNLGEAKSQKVFGTQMTKMMGFQKKDMRHGSGENKVSTYLGIRLLKIDAPSAE